MLEYPKPEDLDELAQFGMDGFDPTDVQAAISASLGQDTAEPAPTRGVSEAGLQTPVSARKSKKSRGLRRL